MNIIPKNLETENISITDDSTCASIVNVHLKTEKAVQTFQKPWKEQFPTYNALQVGDSVSIIIKATPHGVTQPAALYAPRELMSLVGAKQMGSHILKQAYQKLQTTIKGSPFFQSVSKYKAQWH